MATYIRQTYDNRLHTLERAKLLRTIFRAAGASITVKVIGSAEVRCFFETARDKKLITDTLVNLGDGVHCLC